MRLEQFVFTVFLAFCALSTAQAFCKSNADCPSSYCMMDPSKSPPYECHECGDDCCLKNEDCSHRPGSWCMRDDTKSPPYWCHGAKNEGANLLRRTVTTTVVEEFVTTNEEGIVSDELLLSSQKQSPNDASTGTTPLAISNQWFPNDNSCSSASCHCLTEEAKYYVRVINRSQETLEVKGWALGQTWKDGTACAYAGDNLIHPGCSKMLGYNDGLDDMDLVAGVGSLDFTTNYGKREWWFGRHFFQVCITETPGNVLLMKEC